MMDQSFPGMGLRRSMITTTTNHNCSGNIVDVGEGDPVDSEDWSPKRMQTIKRGHSLVGGSISPA
jgi:hypothetical protein